METEQSKAKTYLEQKGWSCKSSGVDQYVVETCPFCGNNAYKFYVNVGNGAKDGLWDCKVCGEMGSLYQLKTRLGDATPGLTSVKDIALSSQAAPPLPDVTRAAVALLKNPEFSDVLDYLVAERGFTMNVIERMRLGAEKDASGKKWILIPYLNREGNPIFVKYRSVPPDKKEFRSSPGREVPLYNAATVEINMPELIFVEGEADALACMSYGVPNVVGVPGANVKKAAWLEKIDTASPKKIFLLYDSDKVGQAAAREMANRIGIEKCCNICLSEFQTRDGKPGKDINEWFRAGHTLEEFEFLKLSSKPFDVQGVQSLPDTIEEIKVEIVNRGTRRWEFDSPWPSLNAKMGGFCTGEVIGIIAEGKVGKTTMALNWLDYLVEKYSLNCLNVCLEMTQRALVRKWISYKTETADDKITSADVDNALMIARQMPGDLLFGYTRVIKPDDVFDLIRQAVRRYGVKVVAFDNLQYMVRSITHSAAETSLLSKKFHELATELGISIILIIQPNRVQEGVIVAARNANGSSAIEKDVDVMIALHRNRICKIKAEEFTGYLDTVENFDPAMLVRVDLTRYAAGGACTLRMDGAISKVSELAAADRTNVQLVPAPQLGISVEVDTATNI